MSPSKIDQRAQHDFQIWAADRMAKILDLLEEKGDQYSRRAEPAFQNFYAGASVMSLSPMLYLMSLATKHWHALGQWAKGKRPEFDAENVQERATDVIIYMLLLMYWSLENKPEKED